MRVAVTAQGNQRGSAVDVHFARTRYFLVLDTDGNALTVRNNADLQRTPHLAGTQAAGMLLSLGVQAVITGHIGPKAFATLRSAGVRVYQAPPGTVAQAMSFFTAGKLVELAAADAEEHWLQPKDA